MSSCHLVAAEGTQNKAWLQGLKSACFLFLCSTQRPADLIMSTREASEMKGKWRTASVHTENTRWGKRRRENMKRTRGCMRKHTRRHATSVSDCVMMKRKRASVFSAQYCGHAKLHVGCHTVSPSGHLLKFYLVNYTFSCCRRKLCPRVVRANWTHFQFACCPLGAVYSSSIFVFIWPVTQIKK